jgi:hypothetical protein
MRSVPCILALRDDIIPAEFHIPLPGKRFTATPEYISAPQPVPLWNVPNCGRRDYDPDAGRFTAQDPIGAAGGDPDWYGYCLDDPAKRIEPDGRALLLLPAAISPIFPLEIQRAGNRMRKHRFPAQNGVHRGRGPLCRRRHAP